MKLKKRQFARLKDIAELLNQTLPGTGIKLDKLIADIESVQKVKTVQEEPLNLSKFFKRMASYDHRKGVFNNIAKEGEAMVAAITDKSPEFKGGLRAAIRDDEWNAFMSGLYKSTAEVEADNTEKALATDPKIGDVGYFWDTSDYIVYGILYEIQSGCSHPYKAHNSNPYRNFSKTPPELK